MKYIRPLYFMLLVGCRAMPVKNTSGESQMRTIRYLALGDSYTIGESVSEGERWPDQLAELLRVDGIVVEVTVI
ncbi:MAG TPA: hypothetical protein VI524_13765, partial [Anaerolineales bacterium]|nr:hypothetical protein [Anaerolineales bacterium]